MAKSAASSNKLLFTMLLLATGFISFAVVNFFFTARFALQDEAFLALLAAQAVLSQSIPKDASLAVRGDAKAFTPVQTGREQFDRSLRLMLEGGEGAEAVTGQVKDEVQLLQTRWSQAREAVNVLLAANDSFETAHRGLAAVNAQMPSLLQRLDAVFVAIGGGGLISGVANYIKAVRPEIKVIGVQMNDSDAMMQSVAQGERVTLPDVGLFSDGTAVKLVGEETFRVARGLVDEFITVDTDAVCAAIKDIFVDTRSIVEPAGALAVAAIKKYVAANKTKGETYAAILCGANMNFDRLRFVAERAEVGEEREALFAVTIPEERGSFKRFLEAIGGLPGGPRNVTEFSYRISDAKVAHVFMGLTTHGKGESTKIATNFEKHGFATLDLTHDDLAQEHIRHMVGGHSPLAQEERLLRFVFPERPGALFKFLSLMRPNWNISLFHYRNQGADYGRILVGLQVPDKDGKAFQKFLDTLGYPYVEETQNPVFRLFLKA